MKILLINILFLWYIILSLITNISASVKFQIGEEDSSKHNKKLFKDYYFNLTPDGTIKTVLEDHNVLINELCHTIGSAFGEHHYDDPGRKRCIIKFVQRQVQIEESKPAWIRLGRCLCFGKKPLRPFYIREYSVDGDISVYFVIDTNESRHQSTLSKDNYLAVRYVFDAAHKIFWENYFHGSIQESKIIPPSPEDKKENGMHNETTWRTKNGNQSEATNAS